MCLSGWVNVLGYIPSEPRMKSEPADCRAGLWVLSVYACMWAGLERWRCFVCVWCFYHQGKRLISDSYLICCGISPGVPHSLPLPTAVLHCVCGRVWLVTEFIYLILNQPSNSLIGPVPLLGNEGKWTITLVFVGNGVSSCERVLAHPFECVHVR